MARGAWLTKTAIAVAWTCCGSLQSVAADPSPRSTFEPLRIRGQFVRWFPGQSGQVALTYAIVNRESVSTPDAANCKYMRPPGHVLKSSGIGTARFREILRSAFDTWQQAANIRFAEVEDVSAADIVIGEQSEPVGFAFTNVTPGDRVENGFREIRKGAICFNPLRRWKDGPGGDTSVFDLGYTLKHEIGHVIGLDHPSRRGQLMSFRYSEDLTELTAGDAAGAAFVYGAPPIASDNKLIKQARALATDVRSHKNN